MRNSRDKWVFLTNTNRKALSIGDIKYWKSNLHKILKIGTEFEFNLPESSGSCKGNNTACPCKNMKSSSCWQKCYYEVNCKKEKNKNTCKNVKADCKSKKCVDCVKFSFSCATIFCTNFLSNCFACDEFAVECGTCKFRFDPTTNPDHIRSNITNELNPNNTYGLINKSGVHSVTTDGSLLGKKGIEVITIGRRIDYWEFYKMSKNIVDSSVSKGAYVNERCSIHMHLLASYYSKLVPSEVDNGAIPSRISELEKPMPEIILANFHQLCRRYQNAMTWMMVGLDDPNKITRWEKFRVSVLEISAVMDKMNKVKGKVANNAGGNKYGWVNYNYTDFNEQGDVSRFHVEMRTLDNIPCPSIIAAIACLYYALMIKAVEISRYGILEVGDAEWMDKAREIKNALMNNMKHYSEGDRFSDTRHLAMHYNSLISESLDLVRQLKHILIKIGPAYQILEQIAEKPAGLRRCEGQSWEEIEASCEVPFEEDSLFDSTISEYIDLRIVDDCADMDEWIEEIGKALSSEHKDLISAGEDVKVVITDYVEDKKKDGELLWSDTLGTMVKV